MSDNLNLEKFYELDIIEFLDEYASENSSSFNGKKLVDDIKTQIKTKDLEAANESFRQLISNYNMLSENSAYKELTYRQIVDIYILAKKTLSDEEEDSDFYKAIQIISKMKDFEISKPYNLDVYDKLDEDKGLKAKKQAQEDYELKQELEKKMERVEHELYIALRKKDLQRSISLYKTQKDIFEKYPSRFLEAKKELYNELLSNYVQIQKLKEHEKSEDPKVKTHHLKLEEVKKLLEGIAQKIHDKDFDEAQRKIIETNHLISRIPDEYKTIKKILRSKSDSLNNKIVSSQRIHKKVPSSEKLELEIVKSLLSEIEKGVNTSNVNVIKESISELEGIISRIHPSHTNIKKALQDKVNYYNEKLSNIKKKVEVEEGG